MNRFLFLRLLALIVLLNGAPAGFCAATPPLGEVKTRAEILLARPDLVDYRGWLKYLLYDAEATAGRDGAEHERTVFKISRLDSWLRRIEGDPQILGKLRGVQEWAYESPVDGSGQPFKIMIPTDYAPTHPTPLGLYMHGYAGDHLKHSTGMKDHAGSFELAVLGRARGGWYVGLSQADVLQVVDYVEAHWNIDPARIHLSGGSMGGGATFKLGARFPHRFASGQISCGYLQQEPIGNLLTFPIYATHSDDDPVVPINLSRVPLRELRLQGGQVVYDQATGFGHAVWNYAAGNARSEDWAAYQVKPASREIRHIDYTATDGAAVRGWWAEVAEWGPEPAPARFVCTVGADNTLYLELHNVERLRIRIADSPFDRSKPLRIVKNGGIPTLCPAPLPEALEVNAGASSVEAPAFRLHTPGGPLSVYDGSPLLIVYGTGGTVPARVGMIAAAEAASKSPNPLWVADDGEIDPADADHTRHTQNLFGRLRIKADVDVTPSDIADCHLVLIGNAAENAVVAKLADKLPIKWSQGQWTCSDGVAFNGDHRTLGLVHYNPLAPQHLLFWVASSVPDGYAAGATVTKLGAQAFIAADCFLTDATSGQLLCARSFDSRWHWTAGYTDSPVLTDKLADHAALALRIAETVRLMAGADFAIAGRVVGLGSTATTPGSTRVADIVALEYAQPVDVFDASGEELAAIAKRFMATENPAADWLSLQPYVPLAQLDAKRIYRVAIPVTQVFAFGRTTHFSSPTQRRTAVYVGDAVKRYLFAP